VLYALSFIYGAAIGSFVQVVATRLNVAPIVKSKSKCLSCGEALRVSDLIPVLSYIFLRGKCKYCKVAFGIESLLIELGFGVLFVLLYHFILVGTILSTAILWLVYYTLMFIALGVIALYDYKHSYVPVAFLFLFAFLSLIMLGLRYIADPTSAILLGPVIVALPFLGIWLVTKGRAIGFGDVVLYAAVGAFFGIEQGLAVLLISIWLGAIVGLMIYAYRRKKKNMNTAIPFVPFIVIAFLAVLFTDMNVLSFATFFS
jgi:leader peptidase (prepilin peptidase)/N-methyltransferase